MLHDICIGKTGTITQGKMNVSSYQFSDMGVEENAENHFISTLEVS
jgi:magnesium-transporting ATPase (P-type)